jgi:hypothetical protein
MSAHPRAPIASSGEKPKLDGNTMASEEILEFPPVQGKTVPEARADGPASLNKSVVLKPVSSFANSMPGVISGE